MNAVHTVEDIPALVVVQETPVYVTDLELQDLRCISTTRVAFLHPDHADASSVEFPNINVLVGLNGGGKSTLLKGVLLAVLGRDLDRPGQSWGSWPRKGGSRDCRAQADLVFHGEDVGEPADADSSPSYRSQRHASIRRATGALEARAPAVADGGGRLRSPSFFLVGYGAGREVDERSTIPGTSETSSAAEDAGRAVDQVSNLMFGGPPLIPLETWLSPEDPRFDEVVNLVDDLLPAETRFAGEREDSVFTYENRGVAVPRRALSDGLQSYLAWMTDLVFRLYRASRERRALSETVGVVLVDEIDQRMHPRWQQSVLARLGGTLPRLQFLLTSHSPLITGGLRANNLILLEEDPDAPGPGATRARRLNEDVYGATADQVLTSSYFDLEMSRSQGFHSVLRQLSLASREDDPEAALLHMRTLAATGQSADGGGLRRRPLKPASDGKPTRDDEDAG